MTTLAFILFELFPIGNKDFAAIAREKVIYVFGNISSKLSQQVFIKTGKMRCPLEVCAAIYCPLHIFIAYLYDNMYLQRFIRMTAHIHPS